MAVITLIYGVRDAKKKLSHFEMNLPSGTTLADVTTFATGMIPLVLALITGGLVSVGATINLDSLLSVGDDVAAATSDVEEGAAFQFETVNGFPTGLRLPTFDEAKFIAGTNLVNTADAAVIAFNLAMVAVGIGGIEPCDKRGEDIVTIVFEKEEFLAS